MSLLLATGGAAAQSATRPIMVARLVEALQDVDLARPMQLRAGVAGHVWSRGLVASLFDEARWEHEAFLYRNTFAPITGTRVHSVLRPTIMVMDESDGRHDAIRTRLIVLVINPATGRIYIPVFRPRRR